MSEELHTSDPHVVMTQWVVYFNPSDYPGKYVVRGTDILRGVLEPVHRTECAVFESLRDAREALLRDPNLVLIARDPSDDPIIVEVWI